MEAESAPLFLWAQQVKSADMAYRKFVRVFHHPFLEPLSLYKDTVGKARLWEKEKVTSRSGMM